MRLALVAIAFLAACTQFPELDSRTTRAPSNAPYPNLAPIDELLAGLPAPERGERIAQGLAGRAAALRARAARLRSRPVIDQTTRSRFQAAILRHRG